MLHTLHLGVYKVYCIAVICSLILAEIFADSSGGRENLVELSVRRIKVKLDTWYKQQKHRYPIDPVYELQELIPSMLGTDSKRCLSTKAAETGTLIFFCRDMAAQYERQLGDTGPYLKRFGDAICRMLVVLRKSPRVLSPAQYKELVGCATTACQLRADAGIKFIPKFHLMLHLVANARFSGNPNYHNTFVDEHWNGELKKLAACCYRRTWYFRVLTEFRYRLRLDRKRARSA